MKVKRSKSAPENRLPNSEQEENIFSIRTKSLKGVFHRSSSLSQSQLHDTHQPSNTIDSDPTTAGTCSHQDCDPAIDSRIENLNTKSISLKESRVIDGVCRCEEVETRQDSGCHSQCGFGVACNASRTSINTNPSMSVTHNSNEATDELPEDDAHPLKNERDVACVVEAGDKELEEKLASNESTIETQEETPTLQSEELQTSTVSASSLLEIVPVFSQTLNDDDEDSSRFDDWTTFHFQDISSHACTICYSDIPVRNGGNQESTSEETEQENSDFQDCPVCYGCFCNGCCLAYLNVKIYDGFTVIYCPGDSCTRVLSDALIKKFATEDAYRVYIKNRVETENNPKIKTCPGCSKVYHFTENPIPKKVQCKGCGLNWCAQCHAPWHGNMTCKQFQKDIAKGGGRKALKTWAKSEGRTAANARKCPKCRFYIERISGCDHMTCTRCHTDFCFRCGKRHISVVLLGDHYSTFSFLGCKHNLLPKRPALRFLVRSSVLVFWVCVTPFVAVALATAGGLVVAASPILLSAFAVKKCRKHCSCK